MQTACSCCSLCKLLEVVKRIVETTRYSVEVITGLNITVCTEKYPRLVFSDHVLDFP